MLDGSGLVVGNVTSRVLGSWPRSEVEVYLRNGCLVLGGWQPCVGWHSLQPWYIMYIYCYRSGVS
jgi:hypothetical protein